MQAKPMDVFGSSLVGRYPPWLGSILLGKRRWRPLDTFQRHVNIDFILLVLAQQRLVHSGLESGHFIQVNVGKETKLVAARSCRMARDGCMWNVISVSCILHPNGWFDWGRKDTI